MYMIRGMGPMDPLCAMGEQSSPKSCSRLNTMKEESHAGKKDDTTGPSGETARKGCHDAGRRVRQGRNGPYEARQAPGEVSQTGDCDRSVQGAESRCEGSQTRQGPLISRDPFTRGPVHRHGVEPDRKSTRLNSSHQKISY